MRFLPVYDLEDGAGSPEPIILSDRETVPAGLMDLLDTFEIDELGNFIPNETQPEAPAEQAEAAEATESTSEPEGDAAPETASSDEQGKDEPAQPAIAPPASWTADAKEAFAKLPPDLQKVVSEREGQREKATQQKLSEIAEQRKAFESEKQAVVQERARYAQELTHLVQQLGTQVQNEFSDIKSPADLGKLAMEDPARFTRFQAAQMQIQAAANQRNQILQQQQAEQTAKEQEYLTEQGRLLAEKVPDFADPAKSQALKTEIRTALAERGFSKDEIEGLKDARTAALVAEFVQMKKTVAEFKAKEAAQAAKAAAAKPLVDKKVAAAPPKVVKPAAATSPQDVSHQARTAAIKKFASSKNSHEQAAILAQFLPD